MSAVTDIVQAPAERRFKPYPKYKDSGVEWLGEVPLDWVVAPIYARYEVALGKMLDAKRASGAFPGRYLRNVDVQWDRINVENLPVMDFPLSERSRYRLRDGDLLVCEGGEVGRTATWHSEIEECFYQKALHRVRPVMIREVPRFFYYIMSMLAKRGVFSAGGNPNTIDHLTATQLRHYRVAFAPPSDQRAIATFLDRETARIDALVAKKEQLIELLQEERTTLITRAVTGLDLKLSDRFNRGRESLLLRFNEDATIDAPCLQNAPLVGVRLPIFTLRAPALLDAADDVPKPLHLPMSWNLSEPLDTRILH